MADCVAPPSNLVSWWPGDGNANDIRGNNNGTLQGGATATGSGEVAQAFGFNGSTGYVSIGNPASLKIAGAISIDAWINPSAGPPADQLAAIVTKWAQDFSVNSTSDSYGLWIVNRNGSFKLFSALHKASGAEITLEGGAIPLNTWSHVAMTFQPSSGQYLLYVNGSQVASVNSVGDNLATDRNVAIGKEESFLPRYFTGLIDEVEIFNRALSQSEIQSIVNAGAAGKCKSGTPTPSPTPTGTPTATPTATPSTLGLIVFDRSPLDAPQKAEIFTMNSDGSNQVQITNTGAANSDPKWSPDGTKIAFVSDRDGNLEIYVMNADGTNQLRLTNNTVLDVNPDWSPDGTKIVFTSDPGESSNNRFDIYVMNADGSNRVRLTSNPGNDYEPAWSPDGKKIAFASGGGQVGISRIYVMNPDGSNQTALNNSTTLDQGPAWSPDGTRIAFTTGGTRDIAVMNADGTNPVMLTNYGTGTTQQPAWSPDGNWISFGSDKGITITSKQAIFLIKPDGSNLTQITFPPGFDRSSHWKPTAATILANISTRLRVESGDNVLIGGFIITGTQPKKVIIRGIGTSLTIPDKLADPTLELHGPNGLIESNNNWVDSPNKQAIIDSTIPPTSNLEAAIVRTLPANGTGYTAIVRGANGGTGIGVVEAYDLDRTVNSKLANISTRGLVQTGDNVLIAGTIILGQNAQKVIVRALGPSVNVPGRLANPALELRDQNGGVVEANDNWVDSPNKQAIIDSTIPPTNDAEAAIVQTLPANGASYTAIVRGVNNTTGIAVVEVYALQ